ncbi:hypothetical protein LY90DRAFT_507296 [Neocallimastix californiae]|uniref:Uncharacterized protein n=1 Tax=Neocallimastix californiae TaxID=1754190 RepID=A0A1Y2D780_9FUNG|nr:hypothetical protein LY90DRAFT_507296 [Neocallimastix californiae]|eukprot:ORY55057.1 hypothetical protein LY90DRAFT_507296 [Neocallimastix californiae]
MNIILDGNDGNNHEKNKDTSDQLNNKRMKSITSHLKDLSLNTTSGRSSGSFFNNLDRNSFNLSNNNIINNNIKNRKEIRSFQTSSSDFIINSSSESLKDKSEYILWNKNINLSNFNNKNYQLNNEYSEEEESDPFESISDLTVSSDEREQHSFINKINKKSNSPNERHTNKSSKEKKNHDRTRNSSNISLNSNSTFTSTITTETNTTNASNITSETDNYQDNITYAELLNNPMKKYEIYQMEKSHNQLMKSWLSFETKIHSNLNKFIKNDFIDLYDYLCQ